MVLLWRGVEAAAAGGVQRLSLGRGPEPYKQIVKTGDEHVHEGRFARWSSVATAYRVRREGPRRLRQVVVANPKLYAVADPVRRQAGRLDAAVRRLASKPYGQTSGVVNGQPTSGSCRPSTDIDQALGRTE
jgi:CelD/BcsL family acetyltransferase involved in cellulose biosynthesis